MREQTFRGPVVRREGQCSEEKSGFPLVIEHDGYDLVARWRVDDGELHIDSPIGSASDPVSPDGGPLERQAEQLLRSLIDVRQAWPFV